MKEKYPNLIQYLTIMGYQINRNTALFESDNYIFLIEFQKSRIYSGGYFNCGVFYKKLESIPKKIMIGDCHLWFRLEQLTKAKEFENLKQLTIDKIQEFQKIFGDFSDEKILIECFQNLVIPQLLNLTSVVYLMECYPDKFIKIPPIQLDDGHSEVIWCRLNVQQFNSLIKILNKEAQELG